MQVPQYQSNDDDASSAWDSVVVSKLAGYPGDVAALCQGIIALIAEFRRKKSAGEMSLRPWPH